ncbi:MAG: hypothetical protein DHS20C01_07310 [marine bacterium B5-7]|nr:MAG: hypothetical protein DHS20C01_07310 [marine bacterium B5-7]
MNSNQPGQMIGNRFNFGINWPFVTTATAMMLLSSLVQAASMFESRWPDTDFSRQSVDLSEIMSGGPPKDGIPAVDQPQFIDLDEAAKWIEPLEPVILLRLGNEVKAYPLQILIYHEIVNDTIDGIPVAVTFCPLCNAAIVFDRRLAGTLFDFGTTGLLRNSDLIMYDRQTESWWQQFSGQAIVGEKTGSVLTILPAEIVSFKAMAERYPLVQVLSRDTGHSRPYGHNPYPGYDRIDQRPFLFQGPIDSRLPAMERVFGVRHGQMRRIYPFSAFEHQPVINDRIGDLALLVLATDKVRSALDSEMIGEGRLINNVVAYSRQVDGQVLTFERSGEFLVDTQTGSLWNRFGEAIEGDLKGRSLQLIEGGSHFAFSWLAFNPDVEIYDFTR